MWITKEGERLREITLKKIKVDETCEHGECNHLWKTTQKENPIQQSVGLG
jgi:uncharacterized protein YjiK